MIKDDVSLVRFYKTDIGLEFIVKLMLDRQAMAFGLAMWLITYVYVPNRINLLMDLYNVNVWYKTPMSELVISILLVPAGVASLAVAALLGIRTLLAKFHLS